jgi:hypothetical protein
MRENSIVQALAQFRIGEYTNALRDRGRLLLARDQREHAINIYQQVQQLREASPVLSQEVRLIADVAERFLSGEWFIWNNKFVNYPTYISDPMLRASTPGIRKTRSTPSCANASGC